MTNFLAYLLYLSILAVGSTFKSFGKRIMHQPMTMSSINSPNDFTSISKFSAAPEINNLLDKMALPDKYAMIIQSQATNILESSIRNISQIQKMESLYSEMILQSIEPPQDATQAFLTAAASFGSTSQLGRCVQLAKAGGDLRAFGAAVGQLTTPLTSASSSKLLANDPVPTDDREEEVFYASLIGITATFWVGLQVTSAINQEIHPWATIFSSAILLFGGLDVALRNAKGFRAAVAGLDRIVLKDAERDSHCDSASFLTGYLLGLPCFCFRPDAAEGLKMLRDSASLLQSYKQPKALDITTAKNDPVKSSTDFLKSFFNFNQGARPSKGKAAEETVAPKVVAASPDSTSTFLARLDNVRVQNGDLPPSAVGADADADLLGFGRVLVWLLAPVAAESLKYGKTIVSDPRRARKVLDVLATVKKEEQQLQSSDPAVAAAALAASESGLQDLAMLVPLTAEDKEALLQWAYYEATLLVRQYGDLLEELRGFLSTDSSSVGECVYLLEDELA